MNRETLEKLRRLCRNISVLYVEDDENISSQLEKLLKKIFINVDVEKNGALGLENFTKNRQDIVITDISMPVMDGIEMSKKIKLLNSEQNIIVTSAHSDLEYLIGLIEIGVDRFVLKPIEMASLLATISKVAINIYRARREHFLEENLKKLKNIQIEALSTLMFPLLYIENGAIVYMNSSFKKHFLNKDDQKDISNFKFGYLFEDKKFIPMNNSELFTLLQESKNRVYAIFDNETRTYTKYNLSVSHLKKSGGFLYSFINTNALSAELDRFRNQIDYFPKRESCKEKIAQIVAKKEEYSIFCIGIKHVKEFIAKYGGKEMHLIYENLAKHLKKEFQAEVDEGLLFIYLFETNRYIILSSDSISLDIEKRLAGFGNKYAYEYGSRFPMTLSVVKENLELQESLNSTIEKIEALLYYFD